MDKFWQALTYLLPSGFAWPRDPNSTLMRVMRALAGALSDLHEFTRLTAYQWQPHQTVTRLAEWEEATGLPDACFAPTPESVAPGSYDVGAVPIATFTRATPATYYDRTGTLKTAPIDAPRYSYNPSNLSAAPLLLIEDAATNLLRYSERFDNPAWTGSLTRTANADTAPDGSLTANLIAGISGVPVLIQSVVATATSMNYSIYTKKGTRSIARFLLRNSTTATNFAALSFNYEVGVGGSGWTVEALPDGWFRLSYTQTTGIAVGNVVTCYAGCTGGAELTPADTWMLWGAQLGPVASSYITTTGSPATRAADICTRFPDQAKVDALRRKLLLSRLRGPVLAYTDSSPSCTDAIVAICAWLGYVATVQYNTPFRCGQRVGQRLGALDGNLYVTVTIQSTQFRVALSRVGDRLLQGQLNGGELACYLKRVVPARYQLNVIFV